MVRVRLWVPPPHSTLHSLHSLHSLTTQSTGQGFGSHVPPNVQVPVQFACNVTAQLPSVWQHEPEHETMIASVRVSDT
jgi:hypothetical protein